MTEPAGHFEGVPPARRLSFQIDALSVDRLRGAAESMVNRSGDIAWAGGLILARIGSATEARRKRRDLAIVELRESYFQNLSLTAASIAIDCELRRFASSPRWLHVRDLPEPQEYRGTQNELLYRVMINAGPIRERQVRSVLAAAQRQSRALAIAETSLARLGHEHESGSRQFYRQAQKAPARARRAGRDESR